MKVHAFVPAAQPDWVQASVYSYYDLVDKIVVSYDRDGLGWNGKPMPVEETLALLREIDSDQKMVFSPGKYYRPEHVPHENATYQRQCALEEAGEDADWVLMFDTDEVLADAATFQSCLEQAQDEGYDGMDYPARWLYHYLGRDWFLEMSSRLWGITASFPGPVAVRPGARLKHHRQCDVTLFRVDFRSRNTDPWHPPHTPVHRAISADRGIAHYSYVRRRDFLTKKFANHGELHDPKEARKFDYWEWCGRRPLLAAARTPLIRRRHRQPRLRLARLRPPNAYAARDLEAIVQASPAHSGEAAATVGAES